MSQSNPQWYDALQGEPLRSKTFTRDLAMKIQTRSIQPVNRKRITIRRLSIISVGLVCAAGMILFSSEQGLFTNEGVMPADQQVTTASSGGFLGNNAVKMGPPIMQPTDPDELSPESNHLSEWPTLEIATPTDAEWETLIDASYPGNPLEILYKESIGDNSIIIHSKRLEKDSDYTIITVVTDEFEWSDKGWRKASRFTKSFGDSPQVSNSDLLIGWYGKDLIAFDTTTTIVMFSGIVVNPSITQIKIIKNQDQTFDANIIPSDDGYTYFFVALPPGERGSYVLEGLNKGEQILYSETYTYH